MRIGILGALVLTALADRKGRRRVLLACAAIGCVVAALSSLAPDLVALGVAQTVGARAWPRRAACWWWWSRRRRCRPARGRSRSRSIGAAGAFGAGLCLWPSRWPTSARAGGASSCSARCCCSRSCGSSARHLPESRRYEAVHDDVPMAGHGRRFWLLAASAFLLQLFTAPASQLMNEFLRDEEGFSALRITAFSILTNTPGGIGLVVGGRLADTRGRRLVGAFGVITGTLLTVAMVLLGGWPMWGLSVAGAICGAMVVPALGVYGPELFPTSLRGRANGAISILGVTGSVHRARGGRRGSRIGGTASARRSPFSPIGPLLMAVLVLVAYPETAHRELEELNPEDQLAVPPAQGAAMRPVGAHR